MRPIFYEIRRTLTSKFVILMIVAIVGLTSLLAYESGAGFGSASAIPRAPTVVMGYYLSDGNITAVSYSYNDHGFPVTGLSINASYDNVIISKRSDSNGFANFTFSFTSGIVQQISYNYTYHLFGLSQRVPSSSILIYPGYNYSGYEVIPGISSQSNSSNLGFQVFYVGKNGNPAPQTNVYVAPSTGYSTNSTYVVTNQTYNYSISNFVVKTIFPSLSSDQLNKSFAVAIMSNGHFDSKTAKNAINIGRLSIYTPMTQKGLQSLMLSGIGSILGLLIPIFGVFAGYLTYGKDKTTGVLESVLKRPATRGGLITSRYVANSVSIIGAVIVSMIIGDFIIDHYFHMYLSMYFTLFFIWTYVVEGLAFLGLIYMFSHLVKSQGALLGITIAIFVVLGLFWAVIPVVVMLVAGIGASSHLYLPLTLTFNFASPSGYSNLTSFFFTNRTGTLATVTASPAAYGINEFTLLLSGFLWIAVPFIIAFFIARRTD